MTPVQLPEVPVGVCVIGPDPFTMQPPEPTPVYTAAQLREYAMASVVADRASRDPVAILAGVQRWELGSNQFGFGIHHRQAGSFVKYADVIVAITAYAISSETNSER